MGCLVAMVRARDCRGLIEASSCVWLQMRDFYKVTNKEIVHENIIYGA